MIVAVAGLVIFIYGMLASLLGTILPGLARVLALSNLELSYLGLAQGLGLAATSVWAGAFMDRSGHKRGIVLGLLFAIVGLALLSHAGGLVLSAVAMFLLGIGGSLVIVGANALVSDVSDKRRASALNVLNLFVGLGGMATPFVAGNILGSDPQRIAYFGMAIALLALVAALVVTMPPPRASLTPKERGRLISEPALCILSAVTFLYTASEFAIWNWLPKYLIASGLPAVAALNILSLGFAGGMLVGRFLAALALRNTPPLPTTLFCAVVMVITTFMALHTHSVYGAGGIVFIAGLSMAPIFPTVMAMTAQAFPDRSGTAMGFAITCGFSGLVVSSPVIGALSGATTEGLGHALLLIPLLAAVIVVILIAGQRLLRARTTSEPV